MSGPRSDTAPMSVFFTDAQALARQYIKNQRLELQAHMLLNKSYYDTSSKDAELTELTIVAITHL